MLTPSIRERLRRDFSGEQYAEALALIERLTAGLAAWEIGTQTDRVEAAALTAAEGDLEALRDAVDLGLVDWRGLLVAAGDA